LIKRLQEDIEEARDHGIRVRPIIPSPTFLTHTGPPVSLYIVPTKEEYNKLKERK